MTQKVKPIPEGYHTVTPYLITHDTAKALEFYKKALGATEMLRVPQPDGRICHAEMKIGDSIMMMADEFPEMDVYSPQHYKGSPVSLALYVENADVVFNQAVAAGAKVIRPLQNQFYGDRSGTLQDPFGHTWTIATHVEDLSEEEVNKRMKEFMQKEKA